MKWRNIVVAGDVGVGTTTLSKTLAKKLGWKYVAAGDFFRQYALDHNLPLWNKAAVPDEVERQVDLGLVEKIVSEDGWVVDGHYIGWFPRNLDNVFRILLTCDRKEAAKRILERQHTHKETPEEIEKRSKQIHTKFKKLYSSENYENPDLFHLVLDTTSATPQDTLKQVLRHLKE